MDEVVASVSDPVVTQGAMLFASAFFYNASTPVTPDSVEYRVDDVDTGDEVRDWTPAVPFTTSTAVLLEDEDTEFIGSGFSETRLVTFRVIKGATTITATTTYKIIAVIDDQKTINLICLMSNAVERRAPMPSSRISRFVDFDTGYP